MKLTKRKALTECIEWWTWLAAHPSKKKNDYPGTAEQMGYACLCPCCEYDWTHGYRYCGKACPIKWPGGECNVSESPFYKWNKAKSPRTRKKYALQIVKLAEEALRRLP